MVCLHEFFVISRSVIRNYHYATNNKTILIMAYKISPDNCIACGTCIGECPSGAISEGDFYSIDPAICTECGTCADACPMGAISPAE